MKKSIHQITIPLMVLIGLIIGKALVSSSCMLTGNEKKGNDNRRFESNKIIRFLYLVNKTGKNIRVKVLTEKEDLFTEDLDSETKTSPTERISPPPYEYPAKEIKASIDGGVKTMEVYELNSGLNKNFDITGFEKRDAGFRITIERGHIFLNQDYYPIR